MWSAEDVVVISDLHLAVGRGRGLFQADEQLAEFLRWFHKNLRRCHLLLNGDVFDFLVGRRGQAEINLDEAAAQATAIMEAHEEVFEALGLIANSDAHELIILGGNHDPELALPTVQREVELRLQSSCSHPPVRWLTNGEAALLHVGKAKILVEHGDQYDAWNWIDHEALRKAVCLASRNVPYQGVYASPPGSRLVVNRFNYVSDRFPWLQTLQPLSASLLPLAAEVILPTLTTEERERLLGAIKEFRDFGRRSLTDMALRRVNPRAEYWAGEEEIGLLNEWLASYEREEDVWGIYGDAKAMLGRAAARLRNLAARGMLKRVSRGDTFFEVKGGGGEREAVARLMSKGADAVIQGHTHSAKAYKVGRGLYVNTGTWGQLTRLPSGKAGEGEWAAFIEELRGGRAASFSRPTFARVCGRGEATSAALFEWVNDSPEQCSAWLFEGNRWQKEKDKL